MNVIDERIGLLRDKMRAEGVDATIIPQTDPHQSEYLADHWQVRRWLSGFTGSAGALVVTLDNAYVWADSRYWLQAAAQLQGTCVSVMEEGKPETPDILPYLISVLPKGATVGVDGMLFNIDVTRSMESDLKAHGMNLKVDFDPADLWTDRPALPQDKVFVHDVKYAGEDARSKIQKILAEAEEQGAS